MSNKNTNRIFTILFSILVLVEFRFFYLFPLPEIFSGSSSNKFLVSILCICIFFVYIIIYKKIELGLFGKYLILLFIVLVILILNEFAGRKYNIGAIIWYYLPFCILMVYFPFKKWIAEDKNYKYFIKFTSVASIILCILFIYQVISAKNNIFLYIDDMYRYNNQMKLRIYGVTDGLLRVFSIILLNDIFKNRFKNIMLELFAFILIISSMIIVEQARFYLICIILSCLLLYINYYGLKVNFTTMFIGILIFSLSFFFLYKNSASILGSINENTGSSYARMDAIKYYLENIFDNFIFGFGRIIPDQWSNKYLIVKGPYGIFNYDDIGIVGVLASMGAIIFLWYIFVAIKMISVYRKSTPISKSLIFLFLISMLISSYLDNTRIICLALTFAWIDKEWSSNEKREQLYTDNN